MILSVCACCGKILGEKDPVIDKRISHGFCEGCYIKELEKLQKELDPVKEKDKSGL